MCKTTSDSDLLSLAAPSRQLNTVQLICCVHLVCTKAHALNNRQCGMPLVRCLLLKTFSRRRSVFSSFCQEPVTLTLSQEVGILRIFVRPLSTSDTAEFVVVNAVLC